MNIEFLDAGCGDAICIRFKGTDNRYHNVFIDGGTEKGGVYNAGLRKKLKQIIFAGEHIDLWIITHIDDDHIGGILRLLKDVEVLNAITLSKTKFWFNYSIWEYDTGIRENNLKSVKQGIRLREYLLENSGIEGPITDGLKPQLLWGAKITILSPNQTQYDELIEKWKGKEQKMRKKNSSSLKRGRAYDYKIPIENFDTSSESEVKDDSEENGSSIAFLLQYNNKSFLFTSDSHSSVLTDALAKLNGGNKVKLDYMQVPHHGSRYNISNLLLALVDCEHYVISADGYNNSKLPNKASMVKILAANPTKNIHFYITQENELTRNIFAIDVDKQIPIHFPKKENLGLIFTL